MQSIIIIISSVDMDFVNRIDEQRRLKGVISGDKSTFTVIYGCRRLGKSTLVTKVLGERDVYYLADQTEAKLQRENLAKMIAEIIPDFDKVVYPDWGSFFDAINHRTKERFTLCIDEFPYLVSSSSDLPSVLQNRIDSKQLKYNIIICGSSQQLMYGLALDATSPLYGRASAILKISPIKVPYISEALSLTPVEAIEEYAIWGGVPRYWELREGLDSMRKAIDYNILSVNGTLYEEPIKLFKEDIKDIVKTATIMSYIGGGANRLSEIAARCGEPATNLSRPLAKLIELGYLTKDIPFGESEKSSKKSLYKIADQFVSFYYRFIAPNRSFIEIGRVKPINTLLDSGLSGFVGEYWERVCREAVSGNEIDGVTYGMARRWWGSVAKGDMIEIDVVAESLDKRYLLVGECKWTNGENSDYHLSKLMAKAELLPFAKGRQIVPILFLKNATNNNSNSIYTPVDVIKMIRN